MLQAWLGTNASRMLTLYGNPGASYQVLYNTNLAGTNWLAGWRVPLTNLYETFPASSAFPQVYYRAAEFSADPPILELSSASRTNLALLLYGSKNSNYLVLTGTNLANTTAWTPLAGFTLTNSFQFINAGGATNPVQFFRAKRP